MRSLDKYIPWKVSCDMVVGHVCDMGLGCMQLSHGALMMMRIAELCSH